MLTLDNPDIRRLQYEQLVGVLEPRLEEEDPQTIASLIEQIKILEEFSLSKKRFFCLFDHKKFQPIYLSANVATESGFVLEEFYNKGLRMMFKHIHWEQLTLFYKLLVWGHRFKQLLGKEAPIINNKIFFSGIKFKDRWGNWTTYCIKQKILRVTKNNKLSLSFLEAEEITAFYEADFVWLRIINRTDNKFCCRAFFSSGPKKEDTDLLSAIEMEILQLIVQEKNNKEICAQLSISSDAILQHQKNMIAKVGVTDITSLICICRLCQII